MKYHESQRSTNFFSIIWEYKNSNVVKKRTNQKLVADVQDLL